jgi:hypothetical protein
VIVAQRMIADTPRYGKVIATDKAPRQAMPTIVI